MWAGGPNAREDERCPAKGPTETKLQSEPGVVGATGAVLTAERRRGWQPVRRTEARRGAERHEEVWPVGQMLEAIAAPANLAAAWAKVRANAGAAGVDGQSIAAFDADSEHQLASLRRRLLSEERYVPPPVLRTEIPKPDGRMRPLGIPTVADRVVQQASRQVIEPHFEAEFLACSFGYRPGRSAQKAVGWVREAIRRGDRWVAEFDIEGFFDHLSHARLLRQVAKKIDDPEVIGLLRRWLRAGVLGADGVIPSESGTPQGGVISPLLANIYLHRLDVEVRAAGFRLIRYADDFVILADRRWKVEAADRLVRSILSDIGLSVSEAKSGIVRVQDGFEFLGFTFYWRFLRPRPRALASFKDRVRARTRRQAPVSLSQMIDQLNPILRGWGNYYAIGDVASLFRDLDGWIRMRLRSKARRRFKSKGGVDNQRWPNRAFDDLGLVRLQHLERARRLSPA
jgi:RNA-directed DNA polymerase